jgi:hypothetical protein
VTDQQQNSPAPEASIADVRSFAKREWPYLAILVLALLGVAYTTVAGQPIMIYWLLLAPFIGIVCVVTRWHDVQGREAQSRLIWTHALHWGAVLAAMNLIFVADVGQMMNADARALASLTLLALGTFTAGVHIRSWRICLVGVILGAGVPAIAWLEQSALMLVLGAAVLIGVTAPLWWPDSKDDKSDKKDAGPTSTTA